MQLLTMLVALLLAGSAAPAFAAKRLTVAQFEQLLPAARTQPDARVADQLSGLELTERVSSARLSRWETVLSGRRERQALIALADASAFLDLPAAEIPALPMPDKKTLALTLSRAIEYVANTIPKLPNYLATRNTTSFEDAPEEQLAQSMGGATMASRSSATAGPTISTFLDAQPLQVVGTSSVVVTYRNGQEVAMAQQGRVARAEPAHSLTTNGEFGPILGLVLADAIRSSVTWGHWEQGPSAPEVVFHYGVPQQRSHYSVVFPTPTGPQRQFPAYHGELAVDPATGDILRVTVVSDVQTPYQRIAADILVEYGPVEIGGKTYICPTKGVALSKLPIAGALAELQASSVPIRTAVNDVLFTHYRVFRAESRIVAAGESIPAGEPSAPAPEGEGVPAPASSPAPPR
jgi:hypothetical protein